MIRKESLSIFFGLLILLSAGCDSPLDVETKRIETQLTNYLKIRDWNVSFYSSLLDTLTIRDWRYLVDTASFSIDTTVSPPTFRLDYRLRHDEEVPVNTLMLEELNVAVKDISAQGTTDLSNSPDVVAVVTVSSVEYASDKAYAEMKAELTAEYRHTPETELSGTLTLRMRTPAGLPLRVVADFKATRD